MTTSSIRYIGTGPLREESITGSKRVWDYGQIQTVDTVIATQLLTTGLFEDDAGVYAQLATDTSGNVTGLVGPGGVRLNIFGRSPLTTAVFGDSIFAAYKGLASSGHSILGHLFANTGQPFRVTHNGGVSGETCLQILARVQSTVTAGAYQAVFLEMGTNNLNSMGQYSGNAEAAIADIISKYNQAIDFCAGKVAYIFVVGMFPFQSAFGLTAPQKLVPVRVNSWLNDYCAKMGYCYLDGFSTMVSVNGVDADTARMSDDFHPGNNGANQFGKTNAGAVKEFLRLGDTPWFTRSNGSFASDVTSKQLVPNPMMYGNTGTLQNGATGTVPANWTVRKSSGAGASTCAASIIPANIGSGFALRLTLGSLVDLEQWAVNCGSTEGLTDPSGATTFVVQGDVFYFEGVVKTTGAAGILKGAVLWGSYVVTGGSLNGTTQYFYANAYTSGTADVFDADIGPALFRSPDMSMPTDSASIRFNTIYAQFPAGGSGSCVVEVEKLAIVKR